MTKVNTIFLPYSMAGLWWMKQKKSRCPRALWKWLRQQSCVRGGRLCSLVNGPEQACLKSQKTLVSSWSQRTKHPCLGSLRPRWLDGWQHKGSITFAVGRTIGNAPQPCYSMWPWRKTPKQGENWNESIFGWIGVFFFSGPKINEQRKLDLGLNDG